MQSKVYDMRIQWVRGRRSVSSKILASYIYRSMTKGKGLSESEGSSSPNDDLIKQSSNVTERRSRLLRVVCHGSGGIPLRRIVLITEFLLVHFRTNKRVLEDILLFSQEDVTAPESPGGEDDKNAPDHNHDDHHDEMPGKEPVQLKDVSENPDGGDPANWETIRTAIQRMKISRATHHLGKSKPNLVKEKKLVFCQ